MSKMMLDRAGWAYLGWFIGWQVAFFSAMGYLWLNRELPTIRMRKLPLLSVGIFLLHAYATLCLMAYPAAAYFSCTNIFWLMSILLPCGIALFHAANSQFLHLASRQKQFARTSTLKDHKPLNEEKARAVANSRWQRITAGMERADNIDRTLFLIGVGMVVQLALTLFVYFGSAKFHPSYGLFDYTVQGTEQEKALKCHTGWEWWLSIVWQFVWAWIYAPYMLWKSRGVRDVHSWRMQTICCCIAGLPATPLWLASLYVPQFGPVDMVFPPPVWFSLFIFFMEVSALGFPIYEILKTNTLRQETLDAIANWEKRQAGNDVYEDQGSMRSTTTLAAATTKSAGETTLISNHSLQSQKSNMLTMTALENALRTNAIPLLQFAALKDFSGENVSFLTHIADWRRYWFSPRLSTAEHRKQQFITAVRIYSHFISLEFSEFPINISSKEMKRLHQVFESAAVLLNRCTRGSIDSETSDSATPFDNIHPSDLPNSLMFPSSSSSPTFPRSPASAMFPSSPIKQEIEMKTSDLDALGRANLRASSRMQRSSMYDMFANVAVPESFKETVFDQAEAEIKYLILTNTWPKFVNAGRSNSQLGKEVDQEAGHKWMRKFLC